MRKDFVVGIDDGTQTLTVLMMDLEGKVFARGDHDVPMFEGPNGEREQDPKDWRTALSIALSQARKQAEFAGIELGNCLGICPSGQMHGECIRLDDGTWRGNVKLWCDSRDEARELSELLNRNVPQRLTISRWLWTIRHQTDIAQRCVGLTTPSGAIATFLDGQAWALGLGDACGAFPIDPVTLSYKAGMARKFDQSVEGKGIRPILQLLPPPVAVGTQIGQVDGDGAILSGFAIGTPIFVPEGDQPTTLAGALVCNEGELAMSGGTSICANLVTSKSFQGFHPGVDQFMTADGRQFMMCHIQNGTTFMNLVVGLLGKFLDMREHFPVLMQLAAESSVDCGGIIILPLAEPEHGVGFPDKAISGIFGLRGDNALSGNLVRAAFVGSMFGILHSVKALREQGMDAREIVVCGGIAKSPWTVQVIADIFETPVRILSEAAEGSAYGAALMALYGARRKSEPKLTWPEFLKAMRPAESIIISPTPGNAGQYQAMFERFSRLVGEVEGKLVDIF